jgi:hypothetical protein
MRTKGNDEDKINGFPAVQRRKPWLEASLYIPLITALEPCWGNYLKQQRFILR